MNLSKHMTYYPQILQKTRIWKTELRENLILQNDGIDKKFERKNSRNRENLFH